MKRISLEELLKFCKSKQNESYMDQYQYIMDKISRDEIRPVKASKLNGKKPSLHLSYWLVENVKDYSELEEELKFGLPTAISTEYYLRNLSVYEQEREWVRMLADYLEENPLIVSEALMENENKIESDEMRTNGYSEEAGDGNDNRISLNERSFQIWGREKFLQREQGRKILKHCNIPMERLNIYETSEPLAYYSGSRQVPQTILIIENKDTFYSMRRCLILQQQLKQEKSDQETLYQDTIDHSVNKSVDTDGWKNMEEYIMLGEPVHTLVYGAGKGILRSMEDFRFCVEPYMNDAFNRYLYFGDLDYEGIGIYEKLAELFASEHEIVPFISAYEKMLEKAKVRQPEKIDRLPDTKEGQNRNLSGRFFSYFAQDTVELMRQVLEADKYIPQEIINIEDL